MPGLLAVASTGVWWSIERGARAELDRLSRAVEARRHRGALSDLRRYVERRPGSGRARLLLGICEEATGHPDAALDAWAGVPLDVPERGRADLLRGALALRLGRFAESEEALRLALGSPTVADRASDELARLLRLQLRLDDLRRHLRRAWPTSTHRAKALRDLAQLDFEPIPVQAVRGLLEKSLTTSQGDVGHTLALANLAIRTGQLDEARRWLDLCLRRRPRDPAVARAWLDWAIAAARPDEAIRALEVLPNEVIDLDELLTLQAWFASRSGDDAKELRALRAILGREPGNIHAIERLTVLAAREGKDEEVARLHDLKATVNRDRESYIEALSSRDYAVRSAELARLADRLGRRFEARGWAILAALEVPDDPALRAILDHSGDGSRSLALADLRSEWGHLARTGRSARSPAEADAPSPRLGFTDDAEAVGLTFSYRNGRSFFEQLPETMGGGVALLDFDGDGWLDVFVVQGGTFPPSDESSSDGDLLFRNRGDGTFEDVTESSGLGGSRGYGHGAAVGDIDGDGWPDLFVTRWRSYALYRNRGDGTFEDVSESWGLAGDRDWPTSAAFADLDGDGDLDLYVCHYLVWATDPPKPCPHPTRTGHTACAPHDFPALPDHLFRNDGDRFVDVTAEAGIVDSDGRGLGVVAADLDADGRADLFVANDTTANYYFRNLGDGRFEESAHDAGVAANARGGYQAGMGVALGDVNRDRRPDLAVTNFYGESTTLYASLADGLFADQTASVGLATPTRYMLGFGVSFADLNNDGQLDLLTANGHVNDLTPVYPYAMPAQLFKGTREGRFEDVSATAGPPFAADRVGRGLAVGDLDNDGRLDALLVDQSGPLVYFHNRSEGGRALTLRLEGTESNRDAVGAVVTIEAGGLRQTAWRIGGGSYLSAGDPRIHFGLDDAPKVDRVEVRWPSGRVDRFADLPADSAWHLREGDPQARPLPQLSRKSEQKRNDPPTSPIRSD